MKDVRKIKTSSLYKRLEELDRKINKILFKAKNTIYSEKDIKKLRKLDKKKEVIVYEILRRKEKE